MEKHRLSDCLLGHLFVVITVENKQKTPQKRTNNKSTMKMYTALLGLF